MEPTSGGAAAAPPIATASDDASGAAAAVMDLAGDGGALKTTLAGGSGDLPAAGDRITARYVGSFASGEIFDRSPDEQPLQFLLGQGEVIRGWDLAFASMQVGERARLEIRHDHGYGEAGLPGKIPPHAVLCFEVELLAVTPADQLDPADEAGALAIEDGAEGAGPQPEGPRTLVVDGAPVKLDHLGPIVLNTDGSMSRITNWQEMTEEEQTRTLRVVAKRNQARQKKRDALTADGLGEF
jgi:hypothetical protein